MRVFKTKSFARFARRNGIEDPLLCDAVDRVARGSIDADLGGGVIKQRVARPNEGRSGGFRVIVLFRSGAAAFFVYGFAKSAQANLDEDQLRALKELAGEMLRYDGAALARAAKSGAIQEVRCIEEEGRM